MINEIQRIDIDLLNSLDPLDKRRTLEAYQDWKRRQFEIDKRFINNQRAKIYRFNKKEKIREYYKDYYKKNSQKLLERNREYQRKPEVKKRQHELYVKRKENERNEL